MATAELDLTGKARTADRGVRALAIGCGVLVLVILGLIAYTMTTKAWPALRDEGLSFFTRDDWNPAQGHFGALAFIYGTVVSSIIALVFAVPISVGIALFITQVVPARFRRPIVYTVDLLAVVPSVVFGLWGISVLAPWINERYGSIASAVDGIPVLNSLFANGNGRSFMTAGLILAIMIIPIITSLAREVIDTTPPGEVEAALGLGATRWEMIRGAVLPHSKGGIVGAVMLGLGRAMGETIAVALVIGSSAQITTNLFSSGDSLPAVIANQWPEASGNFRAALIGCAVTLFVMTIVVNIAATAIVQRSIRKTRGA